MAANLRERVSVVFGSIISDDEKLLEECTSICQIYNMDPQDLLWKWEALNFRDSNTRSEISLFTMDSVGILKETLRRDLAKNATKKPQRAKPTGNAASVNLSRFSGNMAKTVNTGPPKLPGGAQVKVEHIRAGPSDVVFRGPKMDVSSRKNRSYRYMYEKVSERSEALDDRIDEFGEIIREHYGIHELGDPSSSTDEEITIIGRITHNAESSTSGSKLTDATITLESSRMYGSGARTPLRFDPALKIRGGPQGTGGIGLFPGAIAAFKGKNGNGVSFLVTEILAIPPLKPCPSNFDSSTSGAMPALNENPFSVCIASGPYTLDTDLSYKPWRILLKTLKTTKPNVIILIGPFIDAVHPKIKNGDVDSTPASLFRTQILDPLCSVLDSCPGSIAVIVPSIRDLISHQAVLPQAEFSPEVSGADPRIHLLPNPARFSINGITFAATSVDVLFHLRKDEFFKKGEEISSIPPLFVDDTGSDSMTNLCRHLLQQRSFYPIFPVPLDVSHEVNMDVTHSQPGLKLGSGSEPSGDNHAPDVLILPSRLKQFSKSVHSTTAINSSFLTKGTYAMIQIAAKGMVDSTKERIQTEILKLE